MEIYKASISITTSSTSIPYDIEIVGINLDGNINIKYMIDNINYYKDYNPENNHKLQLFFEIINKSPLWEIEYKIKSHNSRNINYGIYEIIIIININNELISTYIDNSLGLNYIILEKFIQLPNFYKTDLINKSIIPYTNTNIILSPKFKLSLYDYQKKSLIKMISLEKQTTDIEIFYSYKMNFNNMNLMLDPFTNTKITTPLKLTLKTKGGILSDEMGLGKTITSIALIISNPPDNNLPFINNDGNKINSKATLIICPSHLAKQWESEIKRCCPHFKIILILSKTEYNHYIFNDFIESDIIITSHQFIMNFKFYPTLYYKSCTVTGYNHCERKIIINQYLLNIICDFSINDIKNLNQPLFEFFNFHRLILDEGHEIFAELLSNISLAKYMAQWITSIECLYVWFISGTPFINYSGVKNAANFIKLSLEDKNRNINFSYNLTYNNNIDNFIHKEYLWNNILDKICIRHRKCDIEYQINIPGYEEKIIWLNFTNIEKELYEAKKNKMCDSYLQQLCCHPLVVETTKKIFGNIEVDLEIMQDKLIEYHKQNYETYKNKLEKLIIGKPEYHMLKKSYQNQMHESHYLYTILEKMKKPETLNELENEVCCICMDDIKLPAMTNCGHIFCSLCLKKCLEQKNICPICKTNLKNKEIFVVNNLNKNIDKDINPLIKKYGSKLGKLISYIKSLVELKESKIIIFSQWDEMLSLISKTLIDNNINNSFVKGNMWRRTNAINKFTSINDENKVIMLSLKNAASGTNLSNATHIFFVEPINASKEEINTIESQAIARACRIGQTEKVLVIRILIKDTIEEEIYNNNYI